MATIDLYKAPAGFPFPVDRGGLPYDQLETAFGEQYNYTIDEFQSSLHGNMDADNWAGGPSDLVLDRHVQAGAIADVWTVGGTANLDYAAYLFSGVERTWDGAYGIFSDKDFQDGPPGQAYAIPGLSKTFHVDKNSTIILFWSFETIVDTYDDGLFGDDRSAFGLMIDGYDVPGLERIVPPSKTIDVADAYTAANMYGYARSRRWGGHHVFNVGPGEHTVGIFVTAAKNIRMTRVRNRGMQALILAKD